MTSLNFKKSGFTVLAILSLSLFGVSCSGRPNESRGRNVIENAQLIAVYERDGYDEVYVVNPDGDEVAHYFLVDKNDSLSFTVPDGVVLLKTPLDGAVIDSEVYASAFEEMGRQNLIKGLFDVAYVTSPDLKQRIKEGKIADAGNSSEPNLEKILAMQPEAVFISFFEGMKTQSLEKLGVPIIKMYDLQEPTPLGRAEWVRFIARLVGEEEAGDSIFHSVKSQYENIKSANAALNQNSPKVLTELIYQGVWSVPGGGSYQANLLKDAGGKYFKDSDNSTGSLNLSPETVLQEGGDADIWIIRYFGDANELESILDNDPLYADIKARKNGNIYFSNTSTSGLFREFPFHPEMLLNDYKIIFRGDSVSSLRYFQKLEK